MSETYTIKNISETSYIEGPADFEPEATWEETLNTMGMANIVWVKNAVIYCEFEFDDDTPNEKYTITRNS